MSGSCGGWGGSQRAQGRGWWQVSWGRQQVLDICPKPRRVRESRRRFRGSRWGVSPRLAPASSGDHRWGEMFCVSTGVVVMRAYTFVKTHQAASLRSVPLCYVNIPKTRNWFLREDASRGRARSTAQREVCSSSSGCERQISEGDQKRGIKTEVLFLHLGSPWLCPHPHASLLDLSCSQRAGENISRTPLCARL